MPEITVCSEQGAANAEAGAGGQRGARQCHRRNNRRVVESGGDDAAADDADRRGAEVVVGGDVQRAAADKRSAGVGVWVRAGEGQRRAGEVRGEGAWRRAIVADDGREIVTGWLPVDDPIPFAVLAGWTCVPALVPLIVSSPLPLFMRPLIVRTVLDRAIVVAPPAPGVMDGVGTEGGVTDGRAVGGAGSEKLYFVIWLTAKQKGGGAERRALPR